MLFRLEEPSGTPANFWPSHFLPSFAALGQKKYHPLPPTIPLHPPTWTHPTAQRPKVLFPPPSKSPVISPLSRPLLKVLILFSSWRHHGGGEDDVTLLLVATAHAHGEVTSYTHTPLPGVCFGYVELQIIVLFFFYPSFLRHIFICLWITICFVVEFPAFFFEKRLEVLRVLLKIFFPHTLCFLFYFLSLHIHQQGFFAT